MKDGPASWDDAGLFADICATPGVAGFDIETTIDRVIRQQVCTLQIAHEDGRECLLRVYGEPALLTAAGAALDGARCTLAAHSAIFEQTQMMREGFEPRLECTMLMGKVLRGEMRPDEGAAQGFSLAALAKTELGVLREDKALQKRDWRLPLDDAAVDYAMQDARDALHLWLKFSAEASNSDWSGYGVIRDALPGIAEVNLTGLRLDKGAHTDLCNDLRMEIADGERHLSIICGEEIANHNSPKQIGEWIAARLIPDGVARTPRAAAMLFAQVTEKHWRTSSLGFSLDKGVVQSVLEEVEICSPVVGEYLRARAGWMKAVKLFQAFGPTLADKVDADGMVRSQVRPHGAKTSRTSAADPNIQQMPAEPEFRVLFIARNGRVLIICDFGQMELRVGAIIARDETMMDVFRRGEDIHSATAIRVFGFDAATFDPDGNPVHKSARKKSKAPNFAALYGAEAGAIAMSTGLPFAEALDLLNAWLTVYSGVARYRREQPEQAQKDGFVQLASGQKIKVLPSTRPAQAINAPVQGGCASVFYRAIARVRNALRAAGLDARMAGLVHDEIILDSSEADAPAAAEILQREMVGALLDFYPEAADLGMSDLADAGIVRTWAEK